VEKDDSQLLSHITGEEGVGWKHYSLRREDTPDMNKMTMRMNLAGVCSLSRRLMAIERARMLGRRLVDIHAWALELEARRWIEERANGKKALRGTQ
jgi:hypothetical protein